MGRARCLVGLDVGSTRTCAVIAEAGGGRELEGEPLRVLGVGMAPTEGIERAAVTHLEAAVASVRAAVREAETMAGYEVESAYVGLPAVHARIFGSRGVVAVSGAEVDGDHLRRVEEVGRAVPISPDQELLHALCQEYLVDGHGGIQDPVGMTATRLEAEVCIVTASARSCRDLRRAVDKAGWRLEELVLEPLAAGLAVLGDEEREAGVALVDVGGASTDVLVFQGRRIRQLRTVPWGSSAVTRDISRGLGVPQEEAERLKERQGEARREAVDPDDRVELTGPGLGAPRKVSRELLAHIIEQRLDEIFGLVYDGLEEDGLLDILGAGVVLTGGGSQLPGTVELARSVFNLPVRLGQPGRGVVGVADPFRKPRLAVAVGLAMYGSGRERGGSIAGAGRVLSRVGEWLRDFF